MKLVAISEFGQYSIGSPITDSEEIAVIEASTLASYVVRVGVDLSPTPTILFPDDLNENGEINIFEKNQTFSAAVKIVIPDSVNIDADSINLSVNHNVGLPTFPLSNLSAYIVDRVFTFPGNFPFTPEHELLVEAFFVVGGVTCPTASKTLLDKNIDFKYMVGTSNSSGSNIPVDDYTSPLVVRCTIDSLALDADWIFANEHYAGDDASGTVTQEDVDNGYIEFEVFRDYGSNGIDTITFTKGELTSVLSKNLSVNSLIETPVITPVSPYTEGSTPVSLWIIGSDFALPNNLRISVDSRIVEGDYCTLQYSFVNGGNFWKTVNVEAVLTAGNIADGYVDMAVDIPYGGWIRPIAYFSNLPLDNSNTAIIQRTDQNGFIGAYDYVVNNYVPRGYGSGTVIWDLGAMSTTLSAVAATGILKTEDISAIEIRIYADSELEGQAWRIDGGTTYGYSDGVVNSTDITNGYVSATFVGQRGITMPVNALMNGSVVLSGVIGIQVAPTP